MVNAVLVSHAKFTRCNTNMLIHSVQQPQQAVMSSSILINLQRLKGGLSSELFAYRRCIYSAEISGNAEKKRCKINNKHLKTLLQFWKQFLYNLDIFRDCPFLPLQAVDFASLTVRSSKRFKIISSLPKRGPNTQYWPLRKASFTPFLAIGGRLIGDPEI